MNSKERVLATLKSEPTDCVPFAEPGVGPAAAAAFFAKVRRAGAT